MAAGSVVTQELTLEQVDYGEVFQQKIKDVSQNLISGGIDRITKMHEIFFLV